MTDLEIQSRIRAPWFLHQGHLACRLKFVDFKQCFDYMTRLAKVCDELNHHPTWTNEYRLLSIQIRTHEKNAVTELDFDFIIKATHLLQDFHYEYSQL